MHLFKSAWQHSTFHQATTHLQNFAQVAMRSSIRAVKKFGKRIANDADYIATALSLFLNQQGELFTIMVEKVSFGYGKNIIRNMFDSRVRPLTMSSRNDFDMWVYKSD